MPNIKFEDLLKALPHIISNVYFHWIEQCFCAPFFMHASSKRMCLYGLIIGCFGLSISHCTASSLDISIRQPCQSYRRKYFCNGTQNKNYGVFYERMWAIDFEGNFKWNVHWWTKCFKIVGSLLLFFPSSSSSSHSYCFCYELPHFCY